VFRFALYRLILALLVAITVSFVAFLVLNLSTDPVRSLAGAEATQETIDALRVKYGFDRPLVVQYGSWLLGLVQGDMGDSYYWHRPISQLILDAAPTTITLAFSSLLITIIIAIPLGTIAALKPNSLVDRVCLGIAVSAQALPNFWLSLMLIVLFAVMVPIFPVSGSGTWLHFVLPAFVLGTTSVPAAMRLTRSGVIEVLASDYVRTAKAKGFRGRDLMTRHVLRNAALPVISILAVQLGNKLGGSIIVESVFALRGLGRLAIESIRASDIQTVQMLLFIFALTFVLLNFLADVINAWIDPRLRLS
jgi:peptide/nickel transport system permease protein